VNAIAPEQLRDYAVAQARRSPDSYLKEPVMAKKTKSKKSKKAAPRSKKSTAKPMRTKNGVKAKKTKKNKVTAKRAKKAVKKSVKKTSAKKLVVSRKPAKAKTAAGRRGKDVIGEGNYTASRNFRKEETAFVRRNKKRIPQMGREAEAALDGPEGDELRSAEREAASHAER
jgi:hypothetical protein